MTRRLVHLLLLGTVFVTYAAAADQDLILDGRAALLAVRGNPVLTYKSETQLQTTAPAAAVYLALYTDLNGQAPGGCKLDSGATIQLLDHGHPFLEVVVSSTFTVNALMGTSTAGKFANIPDTDPYVSFQLNGYNPVYEFAVIKNTDPCTGFGSSFRGNYLRISTDAPIQATTTGLDEGDPPIPISGNSLKFYAPAGKQFSCYATPGVAVASATLPGISKIIRFEKAVNARPAEPFVNLDGISGWTITAYPQNVAITQSGSGDLTFKATSALLECGSDPAGDFLNLKLTVKPQQFVVDWSPAWYKPQRYVEVPCRSCRLVLLPKKH